MTLQRALYRWIDSTSVALALVAPVLATQDLGLIRPSTHRLARCACGHHSCRIATRETVEVEMEACCVGISKSESWRARNGRIVLSIAVLGLVAPLNGAAQIMVGGKLQDTTHITVTSSAEVLVAPGRAVVFVEIESKDDDGQLAALSNGKTRNEVLEALASFGLDSETVSVWGYVAGTAVEMNRGMPPTGAGATVARSGLRIIVEPVARLDAVVAAK